MFVAITWGKIKPGKWDEYKGFYAGRLQDSTRGLEGLVRRQLLRATDDPNEGISLAFWDSKESWEAWYTSPRRKELTRDSEPFCTGEYWIKTFEVEVTS